MNGKAERCAPFLVSFWRHGQSENRKKKKAEDRCDRHLLRPVLTLHQRSLAGCSPAEPAPVSPNEFEFTGRMRFAPHVWLKRATAIT